ncbi:hypothetical protein NS226_08320 [Aureimonas ureilytica]|uniref:Uncharacterized protein n=2 Tax=Aureimonas ureilytica TaxID=401562 RepID=A0A175RAT6_9HYPH|nr:hypothetical protein NS226_08320 [Aureimonas ureilytica]
MGYVPAIINCKIVAEYENNEFRRVIERNGVRIVQDVRLYGATWRIEFHHIDDEDTSYIYNQLRITASGDILYVMGVVNTARWLNNARLNPKMFVDQCAYFEAALNAAGRRLAADMER